MNYSIYCEKCKSEDIEIKMVNDLPIEKNQSKMSIADFGGFSNMSDLIYRPQTYLIRCKNCGNKKEITQ